MKHAMTYTILLLFIISTLSGCISTNESEEKLNVLVSIVPQAELLETLGGKHIELTVLVPPGDSPHTYEPTPEQLIKISQADAYFIVGSGIEFELSQLTTIQEQNPSMSIIDCSKEISLLSFDSENIEDDHNESEHDHETEGADPHIWTSPENYKKMAENVKDGLIALDPFNQTDYQTAYDSYQDNLTNLNNTISSILEPYQNKSFMVYHPAWGYFASSYQLNQIAIEDDGKQPGPAGIAAIISQATRENITTIFISPQFDSSSAQTIADEINGTVITADPLMENYYDTLIGLAQALQQGFSTT